MSEVDYSSEILRCFSYSAETGEIYRMVTKRKRDTPGQRAETTCGTGHLQVKVLGRRIQAHRMAWFLFYGTWPAGEIDHINGVKTDNRIENLRDCSKSDNQCNRGMNRNNSSGYKGVYLHKKSGKWMARIGRQGKSYGLGYFSTPQEAYSAYCAAASNLHGEFKGV
ncbi:MAG: HNH endonuclease [Pantoea sp.]|nr:HNH endonuclease [Pantoea sp.]